MRGFLTAVVLLGLVGNAGAEDKKKLPHIVVILADDLGQGDLGCYNKDSKIPTRNLDQLAKDGVRFTDAHSPSGVCTPTRYGLLTGRYAWRTRLKSGVLDGTDPYLIEENRVTLPALLKKQGYATACVGKWHLGLGTVRPVDYSKALTPGPNTAGFDYYFGIPASLDMEPYVFVENDKLVEQPTDGIAASKSQREGGDGFFRGGRIAPSFKHVDVLPTLTRKSIAWLEKQNKEAPDKPVFLYLPLAAPHTPWLPTKDWVGKSKAGAYGDFTAMTDDAIGQVLAALKRLKMDDNTLVIVTSDNGAHWTPEDIKKYGHLANNSVRGQKSDIWEGGHRVPFLVRRPGKAKAGTTSDQPLCLTDLLATLAAVSGAEIPKGAGEDSVNMLPAILGEKLDKPLRDHLIHHSGGGMFAIRQGEWKLVDGLGSGGFSAPRTEKPEKDGPLGQLYNLQKDDKEAKNVWKENPEVVERLSKMLEKIKKQGYSVER